MLVGPPCEGKHLSHGSKAAFLLKGRELSVEGAEQVSHGVDRHTVEDAAVYNFLGRDHSRHLSGAATKAHNDRCALLVGLQVSQHNPEGNVGHVRPEAVVLVIVW